MIYLKPPLSPFLMMKKTDARILLFKNLASAPKPPPPSRLRKNHFPSEQIAKGPAPVRFMVASFLFLGPPPPGNSLTHLPTGST